MWWYCQSQRLQDEITPLLEEISGAAEVYSPDYHSRQLFEPIVTTFNPKVSSISPRSILHTAKDTS